ncbi:nibrin-like [Pollicipes pollicipes]|uniref:nibrin-like n=1 Tax=Pollicipes pollicipes TaxID=41117 RepID=UPI001884E1A0|nr:nibrin-like [Pollicipes pollicipes]
MIDRLSSQAGSGQVTLSDRSKYGTSVNGQRMEGDEPVAEGTVITFGLQWNTWTLSWRPLTVATSLLSPADRQQLGQWLIELGATLLQEWAPTVDFLVMTSFKLSVKSVQALAAGVPVVTPAYVRTSCECWRESTISPAVTPDDFQPPFDEPSLNGPDFNLGVDPRRRTLFAGKQFVFTDEAQHQRMRSAIQLAGGTSMLLSDGKLSASQLVTPDVMVMHTDVESPGINRVKAVLKRKRLRMVRDQEIGLAVLRVSTERDCNPAFNYKAAFVTPLAGSQSQGVHAGR